MSAQIFNTVMELVISLFILSGLVFTLGGAVGLLRFPDTYCRMHALSKGSTLGIISFMIAASLYFVWSGVGFCSKTFLALFFIFMTTPVGAHMIAKAAYHYGVPMWSKSVKDDLAPNCIPVRRENADL